MLFSAAAEWLFWDEFGVRFNFIAVDYLVYSDEVINNVLESYPIYPLLALLALLSVVATRLLRAHKMVAPPMRAQRSFRRIHDRARGRCAHRIECTRCAAVSRQRPDFGQQRGAGLPRGTQDVDAEAQQQHHGKHGFPIRQRTKGQDRRRAADEERADAGIGPALGAGSGTAGADGLHTGSA